MQKRALSSYSPSLIPQEFHDTATWLSDQHPRLQTVFGKDARSRTSTVSKAVVKFYNWDGPADYHLSYGFYLSEEELLSDNNSEVRKRLICHIWWYDSGVHADYNAQQAVALFYYLALLPFTVLEMFADTQEFTAARINVHLAAATQTVSGRPLAVTNEAVEEKRSRSTSTSLIPPSVTSATASGDGVVTQQTSTTLRKSKANGGAKSRLKATAGAGGRGLVQQEPRVNRGLAYTTEAAMAGFLKSPHLWKVLYTRDFSQLLFTAIELRELLVREDGRDGKSTSEVVNSNVWYDMYQASQRTRSRMLAYVCGEQPTGLKFREAVVINSRQGKSAVDRLMLEQSCVRDGIAYFVTRRLTQFDSNNKENAMTVTLFDMLHHRWLNSLRLPPSTDLFVTKKYFILFERLDGANVAPREELSPHPLRNEVAQGNRYVLSPNSLSGGRIQTSPVCAVLRVYDIMTVTAATAESPAADGSASGAASSASGLPQLWTEISLEFSTEFLAVSDRYLVVKEFGRSLLTIVDLLSLKAVDFEEQDQERATDGDDTASSPLPIFQSRATFALPDEVTANGEVPVRQIHVNNRYLAIVANGLFLFPIERIFQLCPMTFQERREAMKKLRRSQERLELMTQKLAQLTDSMLSLEGSGVAPRSREGLQLREAGLRTEQKIISLEAKIERLQTRLETLPPLQKIPFTTGSRKIASILQMTDSLLSVLVAPDEYRVLDIERYIDEQARRSRGGFSDSTVFVFPSEEVPPMRYYDTMSALRTVGRDCENRGVDGSLFVASVAHEPSKISPNEPHPSHLPYYVKLSCVRPVEHVVAQDENGSDEESEDKVAVDTSWHRLDREIIRVFDLSLDRRFFSFVAMDENGVHIFRYLDFGAPAKK